MSGLEHTAVTIDKGVPIPKRLTYYKRRTPAGDTLARIEVGDSFIYPAKNGEAIERTQRRACGMIGHFAPKKFVTRTVIDKGLPRLRVWRTA